MVTEQKITPPITDGELVERVIESQVSAYEKLYQRYSEPVKEMLMTRCGGDHELADDLMQDAFIKAYVNIRQFDTRQSFGPWIYTIARNLFIDHTRRRRPEWHDSAIDPPSLSPNPEQSVINKQKVRKIEDAIRRLPEHYETIFSLRYIDELSYEEISEELQMPMGTVKTQVHRARKNFMQLVGIEDFRE